MNILFIHQNFPAQFVHLAPALAAKGHQVVALRRSGNVSLKGVAIIPYKVKSGNTQGIHPLAFEQESYVIRGDAVAKVCKELSRQGFKADLIYVHPGWGEGLFIKDIWPNAKVIVYCEYFYHWEGQDVNFDSEFENLDINARCKLRLKNTPNLHAMDIGDAFVSPTEWQKSTYPEYFRDKIQVIHEGFDIQALRSVKNPTVKVPLHNLELTTKDKVVTFVARNMEPIRGFHIFMRALPHILNRDPEVQVAILGGDDLQYGQGPKSNTSWRDFMMLEIGDQLDQSRVHFLGDVDRETYVNALSLSRAHIYLTYPFVLSWSMLEALVKGVPMICSDTPPVREFINDSDSLVDFFKPLELAEKVLNKLAKHQSSSPVSLVTKEVIEKLDLRNTLAKSIALVDQVVGGSEDTLYYM